MLYLMMDKTDKEKLVKVGFSDGGTSKRRRQYYGYNPRAIMRSSCAGSRSMENTCRKILEEQAPDALRELNGLWYPMNCLKSCIMMV